MTHPVTPARTPARRRSRRSFGKIKKLPSGRYQASYLGPDGERHNGPVTFLAKMDADPRRSEKGRGGSTPTRA